MSRLNANHERGRAAGPLEPEADLSTETEAGRGAFTTTNWSLVAGARDPGSAEAQAALGRLCQTYWYPLYVFLRRQGHNPEDAQDLVQGFFAKLIEKNYVSGFERERGRFRSFLLVALKRYAAKEYVSARREKRGGAREVISLDAQDTEMRYRLNRSTRSPRKRPMSANGR